MPSEDTRFQPGHDKPGPGRPKGRLSLKTLLEKILAEIAPGTDKTYAQALVEKTLASAISGDQQSRKLVWAYIDGQPLQTIDVTADVTTHDVRTLEECFVRLDELKAIADLPERALPAPKEDAE
jgi:hypothetical protein